MKRYKRVFFDANILIDVFDEARESFYHSKRVYEECLSKSVTIYTSCDILTNLYYITSKHCERDIALNSVDVVNQTIEILSFENDTVQKVVNLMRKDRDYTDFEDSLQYILAKESKCDAIITHNRNFVSKDISIFSSEEFLKELL